MCHKQESSPHTSPGRREFAVICDFVVKRARSSVASLPKKKKRVRLHSEKPHVLSPVLVLEKPLLEGHLRILDGMFDALSFFLWSVKVKHLDGWHKSLTGGGGEKGGQLHLLKSSRADTSAFQPKPNLLLLLGVLHKNYGLHNTYRLLSAVTQD